mmetsp:Transcript_34347/g.80389  ORF Transcript_34347/g.80389 Transcript_34347/m.80389 type:complete len:384 (+) Transcript_34347:95-1246(+)
MSRGYDRSRSPNGNNQWISRALVQFGRYSDKRPWGLRPNDQGAFRLCDIMTAWGNKQGVSEEDIMDAVQKNMFQNSDESGQQRFEIYQEDDGNIAIKVNPKRGAQNWQRTPAAWPKEEVSQDKWWEKKDTHQKQENKQWWVKEEEKADVWDNNGKWKNESSSPWSKQDSKGWQDSSSSKKSWNNWSKPEDKSSDWGNKGHGQSWGSSGEAAGSSSWDWKTAEHIQRFIGWMLKTGHKEHKLYPHKGWMKMSDLAAVLLEKEPDTGIASAEDLERCLQETDSAGRFEMKEGWVTKVGRDHRVPRDTSAAAAKSSSRNGGYSSGGGRGAYPSSVKDEEPDGQTPPRPPGPGWTKFQDEGTEWFYYEGPEGKWWCQQDEDPQPFEE